MADVVRIRIVYGTKAEEVDATPLPPDGRTEVRNALHHGALFQVHRPSFAIGNVARDDVVRLDQLDATTWAWRAVVTSSSWRTMVAPLPPEARDTPALAAFRAEIERVGVVWEGEHDRGDDGPGMPSVVLSLPARVPDPVVSGPYDRLLLATIGMPYGALRQLLERAMIERQLARKRASQRAQRARGRRALVASLASDASGILPVVLLLVIAAVAIPAFVTASPIERPRVAAFAMLGFLAPVWVSALREKRDFALLWLPSTLAAGAMVAVLARQDGAPPAWVAAVGTLHALWTGGIGALLGVFSLFASNSREWVRAAFGVALPAVLSGVAGAALALSAAGASSVAGGLASGARTVAVGITALLLVAPLAVLGSQVAAILGGKVWRANPALQRGALLELPRRALPMLARVGLPIALVWGVVWIVQQLAR